MKTQSRNTQLDYQERQTIAIVRQLGLCIRAIARVLERSGSSISLEISRYAPGPADSRCFAQPLPQAHEPNA